MLNHNPNSTQSAVITFDSFLERPIRMGSHEDIGNFSKAVDNLRFLGGESDLQFALTYAAIEFSRNDPEIPEIIIVVTNKDPSNRESMDSLAKTLRRDGKIVNVVGVGATADFPNLRRLIVRPEDMFTPKSFDSLSAYVPKVAFNIIAMTLPSGTPSTSPSTIPAANYTTKVTTTATKDATTAETTILSTQGTTKGTTSPSVVVTSTTG